MIRRTAMQFDRDFTIMPNAWARDTRLSRKARGLLVELLSHSPGWSVSVESLVSSGTEGRDAVRTAIRELERAGYLERDQLRGDGGKFHTVNYLLCNPSSENPMSDERPYKKTITQKTNLREDIRSFAQRPTSKASSAELASEPQRLFLRDLIIHESGELPTAEDEQWLSSLTRADAWMATRDLLSRMPRFDDYQGPPHGTPAHAALTGRGQLWAETSMVPESHLVA